MKELDEIKLNIILLELVREAINTPATEFDVKKMVETTNKRINKLIKESK